METLDQSPTDPEFVQDPYAFYRRARALGDFVWWADYDMPVATTHEAVSAVLTSRHMGREIPADKKPLVTERLKPFYDIEANSMLELERPRHSRLRGLVLRAFNSANIQTMAPEISQIADELIDDFPDGEFDLLTHFAQKLPARVIARLLGVPDTMVPNLLTWSNAMVGMYQARLTPEMEIAAADASQEFHDFLRSYVEERRLKPADDLITRLIVAEQNEARLTTDELISTCILLLNAGHEATVHTIGNGVNAFFDFGKDDDLSPTRINGTVEEIIRFDPPPPSVQAFRL